MFKGVLALTATAAISLAVFANSASAEDLTKFYSTERVSGYKSGEFMILAEDDVNFRSNPAVSNNIISCLPRHSLLRITKDEQPWAEAVWNGHKGYIATEYLTPAEAEPLLNDEDINFGEWGFLMMMLLGYVFASIFNADIKNPLLLVLALLFCYLVIKTVRNSFLATIRSLFYYILPIYITVVWYKRGKILK